MGAFLIPRLGIEMYATARLGEEPAAWLGGELELCTPGRDGGRVCFGPSGSLTPGIGGFEAATAAGDSPRWMIPMAGRALAMSAIPPTSRTPAIRFRRMPVTIFRATS